MRNVLQHGPLGQCSSLRVVMLHVLVDIRSPAGWLKIGAVHRQSGSHAGAPVGNDSRCRCVLFIELLFVLLVLGGARLHTSEAVGTLGVASVTGVSADIHIMIYLHGVGKATKCPGAGETERQKFEIDV